MAYYIGKKIAFIEMQQFLKELKDIGLIREIIKQEKKDGRND